MSIVSQETKYFGIVYKNDGTFVEYTYPFTQEQIIHNYGRPYDEMEGTRLIFLEVSTKIKRAEWYPVLQNGVCLI